MIKKLFILNFIIVQCATLLFADCPKNKKTIACNAITNQRSCNKGAVKFRECLEKLLFDKLGKFECIISSEFSNQNEFFGNAVESFKLRLEEFIASKKCASATLLKDFIACRLINTEENLETGIGQQLDCLKQFVCNQLQVIECEIGHILCQITDIDSEIECMEEMLIGFISVFTSLLPEGSPLIPDLEELLAISIACANEFAVLNTCSDAEPLIPTDECFV